MAVNYSSMVGLSILTGSNAFSASEGIAFESRAVRTAKALFTTEETTPPWKEAASTTPISAQVSAIKALRTIIDKTNATGEELPVDVATAFTTYKALDKLRLLAETAANKTTSDAQRTSLQTAFAKGLADLQEYLGTAPKELVNIAFGKPMTSVKTIALSEPGQYSIAGVDLATSRNAPLAGLTGQEQFQLTLNKPGITDQVTVDLSTGPQPPTIDSVASAINSAIASVHLKNPDGTDRLDTNGDPMPRYLIKYEVTRSDTGWGLTLQAPSGVERLSIDQIGAKDSLVVATGQTVLDAPTSTQVFRYDDPDGAMAKKSMGNIAALDRTATEQAELSGRITSTTTTVKVAYDGTKTTEVVKSSNVYADTDAAAIATDAQGYSYIVGTTAGDLGTERSDGDDNLFLTKVDTQGKIVWQRSLGAAGSSTGAAVSVGADGNITVAGTVNGSFDGITSDGDMVVARFTALGDEQFSTVVRNTGADTGRALAVGADGSIYVGGKSATNGGDAYIARLDNTGKIAERRTIDMGGSESINALAIDGNGDVLALINHNGAAQLRRIDGTSLATDMGSIELGQADARAIAVAADGSIAVGGATNAALSGAQANAMSGGRDGFVTRIDAGLSGATTTYLATSKDDQVDSLAFIGTNLYAGGRTTGDLNGALKGAVDGFVAKIDAASGAVASVTQFGQAALRTEPVRVAASVGGATSLGALGLARGTVNPETSMKLTSQTGLRAGDSFSIKVNGGSARKITIEANDTLQTLADRIRGVLGSKATVSTPKMSEQRTLRIDVKSGQSIELIAGASGTDALAKLGIEPQRITGPAAIVEDAPKVKPGGSFGLALSEALNLSNATDAAFALKSIEGAVSMSQTAYRSLYWDDAKALLADGSSRNSAYGTQSTARESAQLANYQAALSRLSTTNTSLGFGGF